MQRPTLEASPGVFIARKHVIHPALLAHRMQRYSIALMGIAVILMIVNYVNLSLPIVLWFAAGLTAVFALLCAVTVVILHAIAWNFDRLKEEMKGVDMDWASIVRKTIEEKVREEKRRKAIEVMDASRAKTSGVKFDSGEVVRRLRDAR